MDGHSYKQFNLKAYDDQPVGDGAQHDWPGISEVPRRSVRVLGEYSRRCLDLFCKETKKQGCKWKQDDWFGYLQWHDKDIRQTAQLAANEKNLKRLFSFHVVKGAVYWKEWMAEGNPELEMVAKHEALVLLGMLRHRLMAIRRALSNQSTDLGFEPKNV